MKYTDKQIYLDERLRTKLDLMVDRVVNHKFDNLIIIDGREGYGKSNLAAGISYYLAWKSKRPFSMNNVFFLIDDMIDFAVKTEKQVIWWDEAALGGLALESYSRIQTKLLKLLYVARKKQHFYIFVIPKFYKLREAIVDRAIGLIHTYSRDEITRGRFAYYKNDSLEKMYQYWRKSRNKGYRGFYNFLGSFSESLPRVLNEKEYDKKKDGAILTIGEDNKVDDRLNKINDKIIALQYAYATIPDVKQKILAEHAHISTKTLQRWRKIDNTSITIEKGHDNATD